MADITADFNVFLTAKGARPVVKKEHDIESTNAFLAEAYQINTGIAALARELRSKRAAYLATRRRNAGPERDRVRPMTDSQRELFDGQSKQLLLQLNRAIARLKQVEDARNEADKAIALRKRARGGLGAMGRWAAGGAVTAPSPQEEREEAARKTITAVHESIILYLQTKLEEAGTIQRVMMDARLKKAEEKAKSILAKSPLSSAVQHGRDDELASPAGPSKDKREPRLSGDMERGTMQPASTTEQLTPEQLQMFQEENHELLKHYEDQLDQLRAAERSILEISALHTTLHANLTQQSELIEQLVQDSYLTTENLGRGNKELKRASERRSTAQMVFWSSAAFCSFLLLWDMFV